MQKILDFLTEHYTASCIIGGGLMGFIVAWIRENQAQVKSKSARIAEAAMCACLSSALGQMAIYLFEMQPELSMLVGTFCGFLGTDYIKALIQSYISKKVDKEQK